MAHALKLVSWNVHRCIGSDGHYSPQRIAQVLSALSPDIIALQEVDSSLRTTDELNQIEFIARELQMQFVIGPTLSRDYGAYGNAVLTRLPILDSFQHDLSFRRFEPRAALSVRILYDAFILRIVNTHLGLKYFERSHQIKKLLSKPLFNVYENRTKEDGEEIAVLLGDFNEWWPWTPNARRLERNFKMGERLATFPSRWPRFALDRIFLAKNCEGARLKVSVVKEEIGANVASDHLAICATLHIL